MIGNQSSSGLWVPSTCVAARNFKSLHDYLFGVGPTIIHFEIIIFWATTTFYTVISLFTLYILLHFILLIIGFIFINSMVIENMQIKSNSLIFF